MVSAILHNRTLWCKDLLVGGLAESGKTIFSWLYNTVYLYLDKRNAMNWTGLQRAIPESPVTRWCTMWIEAIWHWWQDTRWERNCQSHDAATYRKIAQAKQNTQQRLIKMVLWQRGQHSPMADCSQYGAMISLYQWQAADAPPLQHSCLVTQKWTWQGMLWYQPPGKYLEADHDGHTPSPHGRYHISPRYAWFPTQKGLFNSMHGGRTPDAIYVLHWTATIPDFHRCVKNIQWTGLGENITTTTRLQSRQKHSMDLMQFLDSAHYHPLPKKGAMVHLSQQSMASHKVTLSCQLYSPLLLMSFSITGITPY